jgi:DNA polymerase-3 subunit gamma/tau
LSRCQRFDLRRIPADKLAAHFAHIAELEGAEAEPEALALIARAADGSARDGLSILDQAIAHAGMEGGGVTAPAVRAMLGLSDRAAIRDLFALLLDSDAPGALAALRRQYDLGVDPQSVLRGLLETVHAVTLAKLGGDADPAQSVEERDAYQGWAKLLSFPALHRLWQLVLKGHDEVARAALPIEAGEMALLRVVHASSLPDPGELARQIAAGGTPAIAAPAASSAPSSAPATVQALPASFDAMVELVRANGGGALLSHLTANARVVRYDAPELVLSTSRPLPADLPVTLAARLGELTGAKWKVTTEDAEGEATLAERRKAEEEAERAAVMETPIVKAALETFPDAVLERINKEALG